MYYTNIIKERLELIPQQVKDLVLKEHWRKEVENIGKQHFLNEENLALLENEVFLVLLCFEPRSDLGDNIKNELMLDTDTAKLIAEKVDKNVLNEVITQLNNFDKQKSESSDHEEKGRENLVTSSNNIGQSFEKIILNQAKAMQPAREQGWVPENLPAEKEVEKPRATTPNYTGQDPYREPAE